MSRRGLQERAELGADPVAANPRLHISGEIFALTEEGRLVEGSELALVVHDEAVASDDVFGMVFMGLSLGRLWLRRGRPRTALSWFRQILPLSTVLQKLEREQAGQVLEIELEPLADRWMYEVKLLQTGGQLLRLEVDATTGEVIGRRVRAPRPGHGETR